MTEKKGYQYIYTWSCRRKGKACHTPSKFFKEAFLVMTAGPDPEISYRHGAAKYLKAGPTWAQAREDFSL